MKLKYRVLNYIYSTWIGELYFKYLLWQDSKQPYTEKYLSPSEIAQIVRESNQLTEGLVTVKRKVNQLVASKSKEEYHKVLSEIENLMDFAEHEEHTAKAQFAMGLRELTLRKGNKDIVTPQDKLNMIHQRIDDYKELHQHIAKRNLMRQLRKAKQDNNNDLAAELEKEIKTKYGRS